jgi:hypothetical protein
MQSVMPSQVVEVIERLFPHVRSPRNESISFRDEALEQLQGIVNLIREIPRELITVSGANYSNFVLAITRIEQTTNLRTTRPPAFGLLEPVGRDVATILFDVLKHCPDEFPPKSTTELTFVTDPELRENIRQDIGAVNRAIANAEWKAANVLAGSVIEALLHWRLRQSSPSPSERTVALTRAVSSGSIRNPGTNDLDRWFLQHLIAVAGELNLIKKETVVEANLTQNYRNLIHPGRSTRLGQVCDRGTAYAAVGALEHVVRDLA